MEAALDVLSDGTPLYRVGLPADVRADLQLDVPPHRQAGAGRGQPGRGPAGRRRRAVEAGGRPSWATRPRCWACACSWRRRRPGSTPPTGPSCSRASGLGEGALPRVIRAAYHLLGRRTFLTTGDKESRAWTFRAGAKAPECAGVIHSDLQRGFIRAEVIRWDELLELGSWNKAKEVGQAAGRGQGLRGRRRRRPRDPLQRVSSGGNDRWQPAGCCATGRCWPRSRWRDRSPSGRRGLLGRPGPGGALLLRPARSVHSMGMRFPIDVAFCDRELVVVRTVCLPPGRVTRPSLRSGCVIEAEAGRSTAGGCGRATSWRCVRSRSDRRRCPRPGGHPDRQPRRPVAPGGRGPAHGRRDRLRGHPPHPPAADRGRRARPGPAAGGARPQRGGPGRRRAGPSGGRRAGGGGDRRRHAGHLRSRRAAGGGGGRRPATGSRWCPARRPRSPPWW